MNGAKAAVELANKLNSTVCFANPGTTELDFVAAFNAVHGVRPVLGLHENVCTGAADAWARLSGQVGMTLLHLGAGLGNGLANLHNARRAGTPIVNIVGDHVSWHLPFDPPLAGDLAGLASAGTLRAYLSSDYERLDDAFLNAWSAAVRDRGPVALIVRSDDAARELPTVAVAPYDKFHACREMPRRAVSASATEFLNRLRRAHRPALIIGGSALSPAGLAEVGRLRHLTGVTVFVETFPALVHTGRGTPSYRRVPTNAAEARRVLGDHDVVFMVGASDPVAFFGTTPGHSLLRPDTTRAVIAAPASDAAAYLAEVGDLLPKDIRTDEVDGGGAWATPDRTLSPESVAAVLTATQPEGAVVIDEANTLGDPYRSLSASAPPHIQIGSTAGVLGFGLPAAIGAALAQPERRIITLQGDGSAAYSAQALWTQAREGLNVTTILLDNGGYETVRSSWRDMSRDVSPATSRLFDIGTPSLDWVAIARGFGVEAVVVRETEALRVELKSALSEVGPRVIVVKM